MKRREFIALAGGAALRLEPDRRHPRSHASAILAVEFVRRRRAGSSHSGKGSGIWATSKGKR